jgi:hypothetical protein
MRAFYKRGEQKVNLKDRSVKNMMAKIKGDVLFETSDCRGDCSPVPCEAEGGS